MLLGRPFASVDMTYKRSIQLFLHTYLPQYTGNDIVHQQTLLGCKWNKVLINLMGEFLLMMLKGGAKYLELSSTLFTGFQWFFVMQYLLVPNFFRSSPLACVAFPDVLSNKQKNVQFILSRLRKTDAFLGGAFISCHKNTRQK